MSMMQLPENKTHLIYIAIIVIIIVAAGYSLLSRKPTEVIKTVTKTEYVDRNIVKTKTQYIDRTIVKKDVNGSVTTTTEHISSKGSSKDTSKEAYTYNSKTTTSFLKKYTISAMYPIPLSFTNFEKPVFNPLDLQIIGGMRIFDTPLFLNVGTNVRLNQAVVGLTWEF